jgi:serine/threonine-protein kinase
MTAPSILMTATRPLPAQIGRYLIVRLHGLGAMGRVLLARDPVLEREVAVKLLRDDLGIPDDQRQTLLDRMRQEARAAARVVHPNLVALHDMGEDPDLGLYLVFEYLEGETLKDRLLRTPLGPVAVAELARQLGSALTTAHTAGVLHRDIKPENIILTKNGAKIADFGIARVPDSTLTLGGGLLGTPAYSAPEAITEGRFSPQSDQFSMAATLYEALSGQRAFPGDDAVAVANRITTEKPPPIAHIAGVDPHVDSIFSRALSRAPRSRFDSCDDLGRALAEALELAPRSVMPTTPDRMHRVDEEGASLRLARALAGGAAIGALLTIAAFQMTANLRTPAPEAAPKVQAKAPAPVPQIEAMPVAWLAERPPELKEDRQVNPTTRSPRATNHKHRGDAGVRTSGRRLGDAGAPRDPDAGSRAQKGP